MSVGDTVIDMPTDLHSDRDTSDAMELEPLHPDSTATHPRSGCSGNNASPARRGILRLTVDVPITSSPKAGAARPPPRWRTPEFLFYGVAFVVVVPAMVWKPIALSSGELPMDWL
jgi:hypothetical protein